MDREMQETVRRRILAEAARIEEDTTYTSKAHYNSADIWESRHMALGIGLAVLSAVGAVVALSPLPHNNSWAAVIATAIAGFSAVNTFLNPSAKAAMHYQCGSELNALKAPARRLRTISGETYSVRELQQRLDLIAEEQARINLNAPPVIPKAFQQARRGIEEGEACYEVDRDGE